MDYKPTINDIKFAKQTYDDIILTQTMNPIRVKEAFKKLFGYDAYTTGIAQRLLAAFFQYTFKPEMLTDNTETALPKQSDTISVDNTNQSHSEDVSDTPIPSLDEMFELVELTDEEIKETLADEEAIIKIVKPKRKRNTKKK